MNINILLAITSMAFAQFTIASVSKDSTTDIIPKAGDYRAKGWPVPNIKELLPYKDNMHDILKDIPGKESRLARFSHSTS